MKKLFLLLICCRVLASAQDFPRGAFLYKSPSLTLDTTRIYNDIRSNLYLNTLSFTPEFNTDYLLDKSFNLIVREINLWEYSTGQQMIYEAKNDPLQPGQWNYNYFAYRHPSFQIDGGFLKLERGAGAGDMVKSAVPDSEYNFLQYGRKWYTARFILKMDTTGSGAKDTTKIADIIIYSKTLETTDTLRTLRRNSFTSNSVFQTFELRFKVDLVSPPPPSPKWDKLTGGSQTMSTSLTQERIDLQVKWHGNVTTWLDKVIVEDDSVGGKLFAGMLDDSIRIAASYYTSKTNKFYLFDEPPVSAFRGYDHVDKYLQNHSSLHDTGFTPTFYTGSKLSRFIADAQPKEIVVDNYVISPWIPLPDYLLSPSDASSLGIAQDTVYSYDLYRHRLQVGIDVLDSVFYSVAALAASNSKKFWYTAQTHGIYNIATKKYITNGNGLRPPTGNELKATIGMALAYGAKGIFAWPYRFTYDSSGIIYTGLVDEGYNHNSNNFSYGGMDIYGGFNNMFDGFAQSMSRLKDIGPTLAQLTWQATKRWHRTRQGFVQTFGTWSGLVSDVITKTPVGAADTSWQYYVETGHLKDASNNDYILAVNRRCDTSDTRNITMYLKDTTTQWRLMEVSTTDTTITNDNSSFTKQYAPGDWKLIKVLQQGPSVPQNVSVTRLQINRSTFVAKVSWIKNTPVSPLQSISGYEIYRSTQQNSIGSLIATVPASDSSYVDYEVLVGDGGITIFYQVKAKDITNLRSSVSTQVSIGSSNWQEKRQGEQVDEIVDIPVVYALKSNYPNPFNPSTMIKYELPEDAYVSIRIYNQLGQEIRTLVKEQKSAGRYQVEWNAKSYASGIYICKIEAGSFKRSMKMLLTK
jgi:hypothetical protein